jgi:hypothetical protein
MREKVIVVFAGEVVATIDLEPLGDVVDTHDAGRQLLLKIKHALAAARAADRRKRRIG